MEFITESNAFQLKGAEIDTIIRRHKELPHQIFQETFTRFLFISFNDIFTDFFQRINSVLKAFGETNWTFAVIDPDPETFFQHFKRYRIFEVAIADDQDDYQALFWDEPEGGPESIAVTASVMVIYPESKNWVIYADRDFEIGVVGFKESTTVEIFTVAYGEDQLFTTEQAISNLLEVMYKDHVVPKGIRDELLANFG